jgi:phosphatidylglycerophosphate synthase|tara:strand:- start:111 stop:845 length:735 start_codon:yes stop_codon:yes gene_type:complete
MYYKLILKSHKINSKFRNFKNLALADYFASKIANIFIPFFLILKIHPNKITAINIFFSFLTLILINISNGEFFSHAIILFIFCKIVDHVDGGVARVIKGKTFFGKFADAMNDAFFFSLFYLALSFYCFNLTGNYALFIIGIIAPIFLLINILILDKFSALVRWSNKQNKKNFPSYIRKKRFLRFFLTLEDINFLAVLILFIHKNNPEVIQITFSIICLSIFLSSIINLIMHSFYAFRYLNFNKK